MTAANDIIKQMQTELDNALSSMVALDNDSAGDFISTGSEVLDLLLGGGIAMNKLTLIAGDPSTFKSTLAISTCVQFQRKYERTMIVYLDSENATSVRRMRQLGLQHTVPKTNLTVEKVFATIDAIVVFKEEKKLEDVPTLVVWDSIANTPTEADLKSNDVNSTIGLKARIISGRLPVIINLLNKYNITLIFINQFRDKVQIGPFQQANDLKHMSSQKTLPGGNSPKFNASQFLQLKVSRVYSPENSPYGFRATVVNVKTVKNKFFPDGYDLDLVINPATGVDNIYTNFEILKANKKIVSASWSYLKDYPDRKFRTRELADIYKKDPNFRTAFDKILRDLLQDMRKKMSNFEDVTTTVGSVSQTQETEQELKTNQDPDIDTKVEEEKSVSNPTETNTEPEPTETKPETKQLESPQTEKEINPTEKESSTSEFSL